MKAKILMVVLPEHSFAMRSLTARRSAGVGKACRVAFTLCSLLASAAVAISAADASILSRAQLADAENSVDQRLIRLWTDNSLSVVGPPRAVYVPGIGLVMSAEVSLATAPISLMGPSLTEKDKADLQKKKADRMPVLRSAMREVMVNLAASLSQIPSGEQIAFSLILPRYTWETTNLVPMQITMQASKQDLLAAQRAGTAAIEKAVQVVETK